MPEFLKFGKLVTGAYTIEHKVTDTQFTVMTKNGQFSCNAMNEVYWAEDLPKVVALLLKSDSSCAAVFIRQSSLLNG